MLKTGKDIICHLRKIFRSGVGFLLVGLCTVLLLAAGCAPKMENKAAGIEQKQMSMEEQWGVRVESIRTSAAGNLIDFRYRVKDPDKAVPLVDRSKKAYLIDEASGKVLAVPTTAKVGPLRQTVPNGKPKEDRVYFVLFGNPGGFLKPGAHVTVVIGDFRAENLIVQ